MLIYSASPHNINNLKNHISFYGKNNSGEKSKSISQTENHAEFVAQRSSESSCRKHKGIKALLLSLLLFVPLVKSNVKNDISESVNTVETQKSEKKSDSMLEHVINKAVEKKAEKIENDKPVASKFIKHLAPIVNGVAEKLMSSSTIREKVEKKLFSEEHIEKIDEYFHSQITKDKVKSALEDVELRESIVQALGNKRTDVNVSFIMTNKKMQDAVIHVLMDSKVQDMIYDVGKTNNISAPVVSAIQDIINNPSLVRLAMNNKYFQEMVSEFLKNPDDVFKFKESKEHQNANSFIDKMVVKYNKLINAEKDDNPLITTCESVKTFATVGAAAGEGVGDMAGYYIPVVGKPLFGTTGEVVGGILGTVYAPFRNGVNEIMKLFTTD